MNLSDPPLPHGKVTFADVAMRFVHDMPSFLVIGLVGLLAVQGHAESRDFIIAGLGTMLARSYPSKLKDSARQLVIVLIGVAMIVKVLVACSPSVQEKAAAAEATYAADMLKCVNDSPTQEASKTCRAKVRERWHVDGGDR